jgi:hypothetical protein
MGIKRCKILCRFRKYKLTSVTNAPKKKLFQNKEFLNYTGAPLNNEGFSLFLNNFFLGALCQLGMFTFLKST